MGYINSITEPIITEANIKTAQEAKKEVLSDADSFTTYDGDDLPEGVVSADIADNGAGAVSFVMAQDTAELWKLSLVLTLRELYQV